MSGRPDSDAEAAPSAAYIRGGGGVEVGSGRLLAALVGSAVVLLVVLAGVLAARAATDSSRIDSLRRSGVPVDVTVTSCLAMASGTGITASGYQCRGAFVVGGRRYDEVIGGSTDLLAVGQTVRAVTVPSDPSLLSTSAAVQAGQTSWRAYAVPAALILVAGAITGAAWARRRSALRR